MKFWINRSQSKTCLHSGLYTFGCKCFRKAKGVTFPALLSWLPHSSPFKNTPVSLWESRRPAVFTQQFRLRFCKSFYHIAFHRFFWNLPLQSGETFLFSSERLSLVSSHVINLLTSVTVRCPTNFCCWCTNAWCTFAYLLPIIRFCLYLHFYKGLQIWEMYL